MSDILDPSGEVRSHVEPVRIDEARARLRPEARNTRTSPLYSDDGGLDVGTEAGKMDNDQMDRGYVDAKIEAVRAQNDARFSELLHAVGRIGDQVAAQGTINTERFDHLTTEVASARVASERAAAAASSTKWNIVITAIAVTGVLVAVFAMWMQAISMTAGFFGQ